MTWLKGALRVSGWMGAEVSWRPSVAVRWARARRSSHGANVDFLEFDSQLSGISTGGSGSNCDRRRSSRSRSNSRVADRPSPATRCRPGAGDDALKYRLNASPWLRPSKRQTKFPDLLRRLGWQLGVQQFARAFLWRERKLINATSARSNAHGSRLCRCGPNMDLDVVNRPVGNVDSATARRRDERD